MAPTTAREPFHRDGWIYERSDGWRMVVQRRRRRCGSSAGMAETIPARFGDIAAHLVSFHWPRWVLDGEICVL
jgi:hypothetical protein